MRHILLLFSYTSSNFGCNETHYTSIFIYFVQFRVQWDTFYFYFHILRPISGAMRHILFYFHILRPISGAMRHILNWWMHKNTFLQVPWFWIAVTYKNEERIVCTGLVIINMHVYFVTNNANPFIELRKTRYRHNHICQNTNVTL